MIGSGTISNDNYRKVSSSCIAERRAIELIDEGVSSTPRMRFGDRVRMQARFEDERDGPFGMIDQQVVSARR
jgi:fumarylacetoacetate (FAA) hydrolase